MSGQRWHIADPVHRGPGVIQDENGLTVAIVKGESDMALIEAAPELLDVLQATLRKIRGDNSAPSVAELIARIERIIAAATRDSPRVDDMGDCTPDDLRKLVAKSGLSQREAARRLEVEQREFRRMCSGQTPIPNVVKLAMQQLAEEGGSKS